MNQILNNREMLLGHNNEGFITELLTQENGCYNTLWGQEYIMMNSSAFIKNAEEIIEIMVKCRR